MFTKYHFSTVKLNILYFVPNLDQQHPCGNIILVFNTLRPRQDDPHFPDDTFKCIILNENAKISIKISLKFVPKGPINNIPMVASLLAYICVTRPQLVERYDSISKE